MSVRYRLADLSWTLLFLMMFGCAHRAIPPVVAELPKPEVGTVAVANAAGSPTVNFERPRLVGGGRGAKEGAKAGALAPILPGLAVSAVGGEAREGSILLVGLMLTGAGIALAPVGAGVGAAIGAIAAPSEEEVERCASALARVVGETDLSTSLAGWIVEAAGRRPIVRADELASAVADTRLQLDATGVSLSSDNPKQWQPRLRLRASITARLVRTTDDDVLRAYEWVHEGPEATFVEWGKNDARMLRTELERAGRALAAKAIADLW
jgi:hypothetical protein